MGDGAAFDGASFQITAEERDIGVFFYFLLINPAIRDCQVFDGAVAYLSKEADVCACITTTIGGEVQPTDGFAIAVKGSRIAGFITANGEPHPLIEDAFIGITCVNVFHQLGTGV